MEKSIIMSNMSEYMEGRLTNVPMMGNNSTGGKSSSVYDDVGAMHYIVAVVLIYSSAVIGVFVLGFFSRRQKDNVHIDKQANYFLRDLEQSRMVIERQQRKKFINSLVRSYSVDQAALYRQTEVLTTGLITAARQATSLTVNNAKPEYRRAVSEPCGTRGDTFSAKDPLIESFKHLEENRAKRQLQSPKNNASKSDFNKNSNTYIGDQTLPSLPESLEECENC